MLVRASKLLANFPRSPSSARLWKICLASPSRTEKGEPLFSVIARPDPLLRPVLSLGSLGSDSSPTFAKIRLEVGPLASHRAFRPDAVPAAGVTGSASAARPHGGCLNWTGETLNRIEPAEFLLRFEAGEAVQYFYEPFLAAFDPELRKQFGVWYTPSEIVRGAPGLEREHAPGRSGRHAGHPPALRPLRHAPGRSGPSRKSRRPQARRARPAGTRQPQPCGRTL